MSLVTIAADASIDVVTGTKAPHIAGDFLAGEDLHAFAFCYIKSDGKVYLTDATALGEAARLAGVTPKAVKAGQIVELLGLGTRMRYAASGLTPGAPLYLATTAVGAGKLDTAATTGDPAGKLQALTDTDIRIVAAI